MTIQQEICPQPSTILIKNCQKLLETVKSYCLSVIDSDIVDVPDDEINSNNNSIQS